MSNTNVYIYLFGSGDELPDLTMFTPRFVFISLCKRNKYFYMYFSPNRITLVVDIYQPLPHTIVTEREGDIINYSEITQNDQDRIF